MKPTIVEDSGLLLVLFGQFKMAHPDVVREMEMFYEGPYYNQEATIGIIKDHFLVVEVVNHEKKLWVTTNHADPVDPPTFEELKAAIHFVEKLGTENDPNGPTLEIAGVGNVAEHYFGKYVDTLEEAVNWVRECLQKDARDWDKDYNKPAPFVGKSLDKVFSLAKLAGEDKKD